MIDAAVSCSKLHLLAQYYREFQDLTHDLTLEQFSAQLLHRRAVERQIQLIVECATDINNMILKRAKQQPAQDYFSSFVDIAEMGVISAEFALNIAPSTGLRNILVHQYHEIDNEIVYKAYIRQVDQFLQCGLQH